MTPGIIAIVMVGVALAGVILASVRGVRQDMTRLESRLDGKIEALSTQLGELRERMGAPGRADGRIARSDHRSGQGQLGQACHGASVV